MIDSGIPTAQQQQQTQSQRTVHDIPHLPKLFLQVINARVKFNDNPLEMVLGVH